MVRQSTTQASRAAGVKGRLSLPSNLAWQRSINISEGEMMAVVRQGDAETLAPVEVKQTTIRGAIGSYNAGYDKKGEPLTGDALEKAQKPENPNIQTIDLASLPADSDCLELRFSAAFSAANTEPDSCNARDYRTLLERFGEAARRAELHADLAGRYVWNLANGRVLWRNGIGTDKRATVIDLDTGTSAAFDCAKLPNDRCPGVDAIAAAAKDGEAARALIARAGEALATGPLMRIAVAVRVRLYPGAEVWPSQEFPTREAKQRGDGGEISKVLSSKPAQVDGRAIRHATMHSQKIGNAVRTIDEWHGNNDFAAVPVEAFGWVQREAAAIRRPDVNDAYRTLRELDRVAEGLGRGEPAAREEALYALAIMIRGGVFVMKGEGDAPEAAAA